MNETNNLIAIVTDLFIQKQALKVNHFDVKGRGITLFILDEDYQTADITNWLFL